MMALSNGVRRRIEPHGRRDVSRGRAMMIHRATGILGLLLACAVTLASSQRDLNIEDFRTKIRKIVADGTTPSLAVAVSNERIVR